MSTQNVSLIRRFAEHFGKGNLDAAIALMSDDVVVRECDSVPYPGIHRGREGFRALLGAFLEAWDLQSELEQEIIPAGEDRVLVLVRFDAIGKATGKPIEIRIAEIYSIRDEKIAEILVYYWDTHAMFAAAGGATVLQGEPA